MATASDSSSVSCLSDSATRASDAKQLRSLVRREGKQGTQNTGRASYTGPRLAGARFSLEGAWPARARETKARQLRSLGFAEVIHAVMLNDKCVPY